jgi:hypothetical protein
MKTLIALLLFLPSISSASVVDITVNFNNLSTGKSYIENGFLFESTYFQGINVYSSGLDAPSAKIYGHHELSVSRIDKKPFNLISLDILHDDRQTGSWRIENQDSSGIDFSGERTLYLTFNNILSASIHHTDYNTSDYLIIDNVKLSYASSVPVPSAICLFSSVVIGYLGLKISSKQASMESRNRRPTPFQLPMLV